MLFPDKVNSISLGWNACTFAFPKLHRISDILPKIDLEWSSPIESNSYTTQWSSLLYPKLCSLWYLWFTSVITPIKIYIVLCGFPDDLRYSEVDRVLHIYIAIQTFILDPPQCAPWQPREKQKTYSDVVEYLNFHEKHSQTQHRSDNV